MSPLSALLAILLATYCFAAPQTVDLSDPHYRDRLDTVFGPFPQNGSNDADSEVQTPGFSNRNFGHTSSTVFGPYPQYGSNDRNPRTQTPDLTDDRYVDQLCAVFGPPPQNNSNPSSPSPTINEEGCECVRYYQCANDSNVFNGGEFLFDMRQNQSCDDLWDHCCKNPDKNADLSSLPPLTPRSGCGRRNANGIRVRITGIRNNEAQFGEFPWMVVIFNKEKFNPDEPKPFNATYLAGGSLIHPQAILTGAHRILGKEPGDLVVRAGEWDTQTREEPYPHQERTVKKIIIHERFNRNTLVNDVAILILSRSFDITPNVDVVCLPNPDDRFDNSRCFASGWGKDIFGLEGRHQAILKKIELPIVPHAQCQTALRTARLGRYFILNPAFICAGGEAGIDTCDGDGGGPLVCPLQHDPDQYAEAGIVAWGLGCGSASTPAVYVNVASARRWIDRKMANNYLNTSTYAYTVSG